MKIQLKRSNALDNGKAKAPTPGQMEYGELAVNYNEGDPALFIKDANNQIVRIAGEGAVGNIEIPTEGGGNHQPGTLDDRYVELSGDNMTGNLTISTNKIQLKTDGSASFSAKATSASTTAGDGGTTLVTKDYVDGTTGTPLDTRFIKTNDSGTLQTISGGGGLKIESKLTTNGNIVLDGGTTNAQLGIRINGGSDVIALKADGSALFEGTIQSNDQIRANRIKCGNGSDQDKILLNADGSAEFDGNVNIASSQHVFFTNGEAQLADNKVNIQPGGSATFRGDVQVGYFNNTSNSTTGAFLHDFGQIDVQRTSTQNDSYIFRGLKGTANTCWIKAVGSAAFASINYQAYTNSNRPSHDDGKVIYNSEEGSLQLSHDGEWTSVGSAQLTLPSISNVTITSDNTSPDRFTNEDFSVTTTMAIESVPYSNKGLKAKVVGPSRLYPQYPALSNVSTTEDWPEQDTQNAKYIEPGTKWPLQYDTGTLNGQDGNSWDVMVSPIKYFDADLGKPMIAVIGMRSWAAFRFQKFDYRSSTQSNPAYETADLPQSGYSHNFNHAHRGTYSQQGNSGFLRDDYVFVRPRERTTNTYVRPNTSPPERFAVGNCMIFRLGNQTWNQDVRWRENNSDAAAVPSGQAQAAMSSVVWWDAQKCWVMCYNTSTILAFDDPNSNISPIDLCAQVGTWSYPSGTAPSSMISMSTYGPSLEQNYQKQYLIVLPNNKVVALFRGSAQTPTINGAGGTQQSYYYKFFNTKQDLIDVNDSINLTCDGAFGIPTNDCIKEIHVHQGYLIFTINYGNWYRMDYTDTEIGNNINEIKVNTNSIRYLTIHEDCMYSKQNDAYWKSTDAGSTWVEVYKYGYSFNQPQSYHLQPHAGIRGYIEYVSGPRYAQWVYRAEVYGSQTLTFPAGTDFSTLGVGKYIKKPGVTDDRLYARIVGSDSAARTVDITVDPDAFFSAGDTAEMITPSGTGTQTRYLVIDSVGNVSDLSNTDPGFVNQGTATGKLKFPQTFTSTGQKPDEALLGGTSIQVEVQASNTEGSDTKLSSALTP